MGEGGHGEEGEGNIPTLSKPLREVSAVCENLGQLVDEPSAKQRLSVSVSPIEGKDLKKLRAAGRGTDDEDQMKEGEEGSEKEYDMPIQEEDFLDKLKCLLVDFGCLNQMVSECRYIKNVIKEKC